MATPQIDARPPAPLVPVRMPQVQAAAGISRTDWLWHGLIARRNVTLLTSQWKAGKTTLLTGLMQQFAAGGKFLERTVAAARVLCVSEESNSVWADRLRRMPIAEHCQLLARPFPRRPTPEQWDQLVELGMNLRAAGELDLVVIDSLTRFLPGATDADLKSLQAMLDPLQPLTAAGVGVIILHHPRRRPSEEGCTARGHGGLLAAVDIIVELSGYGRLESDDRRRKLFALSRFPETPRRLVYEWNPDTTEFRFLGDPLGVRFQENWQHLLAILKKRSKPATHQELLMDWPAGLEAPSRTMLYEWLNRAYEAQLLRRQGHGNSGDPYRYRLPNEDDEYWDRGELPPLRGLEDLPLPRELTEREALEKAKRGLLRRGGAGRGGMSG